MSVGRASQTTRRGPLITAPQAVGCRVGLVFLLVDLGIVAQAEIQRIHVEGAGELVHRRFEGKGALDIARRAKGDAGPVLV